jgi:hypothetical protein
VKVEKNYFTAINKTLLGIACATVCRFTAAFTPQDTENNDSKIK